LHTFINIHKSIYMKRFFCFLLIFFILFAACNNNKPKDTTVTSSPGGKENATADPTQIQNATEDVEKQKAVLEKLTPLPLDQLKALVPETLMGVSGINYSVNSSMGAGLARGEYELNDSSRISLSIYDCAGPAGAGIYSMQYLGLYNMQDENDEEYTKAIDFNGGKAFEHCEKATNSCTLSYFSGRRFMINLEGDHVGADELKKAASGLNIK
jgi:hypothetical protein